MLADLLISKQTDIMDANAKDLAEADKNGLAKPLVSRLALTPAKLESLANGRIFQPVISILFSICSNYEYVLFDIFRKV